MGRGVSPLPGQHEPRDDGPLHARRPAVAPQPPRPGAVLVRQRHPPRPVGQLLRHFRHPCRRAASRRSGLTATPAVSSTLSIPMLPTLFETHEHGRRLRVARLGRGDGPRPPVVLLHGYPDNLQIWCELARRLAAQFPVIAFDWPGMGCSDAWRGGTTPEHMADRLRALLDAWEI